LPNRTQARFALAALFAGAAGIGFAPIFVRLSPVGPIATAFYRLALALPALWIWMHSEAAADAPPVRPTTRGHFGALALAGFFFAGDLAFWHWSLRLTSVADATLLANCAPVFVTIGAHFFFGEKITPRFIAGMIVAMLGAALVVGASFRHSAAHLLGSIFGLITPVFYGAYMLSLKSLRATFSTATIMSWSGLFSCAVLLVITLVSGESFLVPTLSGWAVLAALGLISHAGGQSLIAFAFAHLPASFSSVGLLLQPVIAAFLAWIILSESLTWLQAAGGIFVLAGIVLAKRSR
jgi:drug/metabolite transporter (DMT)-like permease